MRSVVVLSLVHQTEGLALKSPTIIVNKQLFHFPKKHFSFCRHAFLSKHSKAMQWLFYVIHPISVGLLSNFKIILIHFKFKKWQKLSFTGSKTFK